jgi:hypothetical protein
MTSSIRKFWQRLESAVHPCDAPVFASNPQHTFNLDFPPPAFIGDVDNAPVVILMLNGGYDRNKTPAEFAEPNDRTEYLEWLRGERADIPRNLSTYYTDNPVFDLVKNQKAAIVNAAAYRSPQITQEPQNKKSAKLLPSVKVHQQWLYNEVLPAARDGKRLIVAHRWSLWNFSANNVGPLANVRHSRNPRSEYLALDLRDDVASWLRQQSATGS